MKNKDKDNTLKVIKFVYLALAVMLLAFSLYLYFYTKDLENGEAQETQEIGLSAVESGN